MVKKIMSNFKFWPLPIPIAPLDIGAEKYSVKLGEILSKCS